MQIVGRKFTQLEFRAYLDGLIIQPWVKFVVVHNSGEPDIAQYLEWTKREGWTPEQWLRNLTSFYAAKGWSGTPHLFIPPVEDQILVLNSPMYPGVHTPSWNQSSIGVETVGDFETDAFGDPTAANLVAALTALHQKLALKPLPYELGVRGLHFHREDPRTTHDHCPGRHLIKSELVEQLVEALAEPSPGNHLAVPLAAQEADTNHMSIEELTSVKRLQLRLNLWNPKLGLTVDGALGMVGSSTRVAVRSFQAKLELTVDGIPGPVTRAALKSIKTGGGI